VSEYQYYEFQAVDRPLTKEQMSKLRACSSRAQITSSSFVNEYHYGDFKGNPDKWIEKYFAPSCTSPTGAVAGSCCDCPKSCSINRSHRSTAPAKASRVVGRMTASSCPSRLEDETRMGRGGWLAGVARADTLRIMHGDQRALYLGWLLAVQSEEIDEDTLEPPVPPGLGDLNGPLDRLADFLLIDGDLIAAAAECSLGKQAANLSGKEIGTWLLDLPSKEKDVILARLIEGNDPHLAAELRQRAIREVRGEESPRKDRAGPPAISWRVLRSWQAKKKGGGRAACAEKARIEREQAEKRKKHLESLMARRAIFGPKSMISSRPSSPNATMRRYAFFRTCVISPPCRAGAPISSFRMRALHNEHAKKPSLVERFRKANLL